MDVAIYALKGSSECDIFSSLQEGEGRFGWSYVESADLNDLKRRIDEKGYDDLTDQEKDCYQYFLLDFKEGDYVIYINVPEWGKCTVARVTGKYRWRFDEKDFNHRFPVDTESIVTFYRNDNLVHPSLRSRLKLQGRWWRIYLKDEFEDLLRALRAGGGYSEGNLQFLSKEIQPFLLEITQRIHHTHPNYDLECLLEQVFKKIPGVTEVKRQGGAGDHGADLLVKFNGGLPIPGLEQASTLVVQVKSYQGVHSDDKAVQDIARAFKHYPQANMGLIVSTADSSTESVEQALNKLREESGKPVAFLVGTEVAAFLLRYGAELL